jgi:hypothetical protein
VLLGEDRATCGDASDEAETHLLGLPALELDAARRAR